MKKLSIPVLAAFTLAGSALAGGGQPMPVAPAPVRVVTPAQVITPVEVEVVAPKVTLPVAETANSVLVPLTDEKGVQRGAARFTRVAQGTRVQLEAEGLNPGPHGFHIHAVGSCENTVKDGKVTVFGGAGGHFDPMKTDNHAGPKASSLIGHAGDMPNVEADANGRVSADFVTDKFNLNGLFSIRGKSVILHETGDDYVTNPAGDSGARALCGIVH